jgi:ubiquinone biosynthesis protein
MAKLRDKLMRSPPRSGAEREPLAIPRELGRLTVAWLKHGVVGLPLSVGRSLATEPALDGALSEARFFDLFGERALRLFDDLGPIYGKAGQVLLSRLSPPLHEIAETLRLTRLYKDWPPIPFAEVAEILDRQVPRWRTELAVEPHPLGVASLAQVHAATDRAGRLWVVKVVKPAAKRRLLETAAALEQAAEMLAPLAVTQVARRALKELRELIVGFRREVSLTKEHETILRVREKLAGRRQKLLIIPEVNADFSGEDVLTVERFLGTPLSDVVSGRVELPPGARARLARTMLSELLVQVFELGLFHADPHAGNLILTEDGNVGLFDWGLAGELLESDRRHIAAILKAVIALDLEGLIDALVEMGEEAQQQVDRDAVRKELKAVVKMINDGRADPAKKPSLQALFEHCLNAAARLGIPVPDGLLMMAKSLITIEGLAKGIDPKVSMARVATPVLFRAARPGFKEFLALGRRLPDLAKAIVGGK